MYEELNRKKIHEAIDTTLSGLQTDPWLAQKIINREVRGEPITKRKLSIALILSIVLVLITVAALAIVLLSPKEIIDQIAVPIAQDNNHLNYTHSELSELLRSLAENGITLPEGSIIMKAFDAGHGYWEGDTIREICIAAFGNNERCWSIEQKYWYGKIMVSIGAWDRNIYLLPEENDMTISEVHALSAAILNEVFDVDLPTASNDRWQVQENFELVWDENTETFPQEMAEWTIWYVDSQTGKDVYSVSLSRDGQIINTENLSTKKNLEIPFFISNPYPDEEEAITRYGNVMHYWPHEVQIDVYGEPYAIPSQDEYLHALSIAENAILSNTDTVTLDSLENFKIGYMLKKFSGNGFDRTEMHWDFMFTTDTEFLSDGYRVQFVQLIDEATGNEEIEELSVEPANLGNG